VFGIDQKTLSALVLGTTVAFSATVYNAAAAGEDKGRIEIDYRACADQIGLVTTDAMLSDVLQMLAAELEFELSFKSDHDRPISINLLLPAQELIETLGRDDNIMITNAVDVRCEEPVDRLKTVWFIGTGPEITYQPVQALRIDQLPETGETPPQRNRRSDAGDKRKTKQRDEKMTAEELEMEKIEQKNRNRQVIK